MNIFTVTVLLILLSILWLPPLLIAFRFTPAPTRSKFYGLGIILPFQVLLAVVLIFLANYFGILNPAGYTIGLSVGIGVSGAAALLFLRYSANQALNRIGRKAGPMN